MKIFNYIILTIIVFLSLPINTIPAPLPHIINIDMDTDYYPLGGEHLEILEDKDKNLTINDIISKNYQNRFRKNEQKVVNLGYTNSAYWIRFTLKNNSGDEKILLLEVAYALLDYISFFHKNPEAGYDEKKYGQYVPFNEREIKHRNFVFKISLSPESIYTCYLRVETEDSFTLPMTLYTQDEFIEKERTEQIVLGLFYGILIIMMLYNLFIYSSAQDKNYLYLVMFILSFFVYILSENGIAYEYLWPGLPWWSKRAVPFFVSMVIITSSLFVQSFIETKRNIPRLDRTISLFRILGIIGVLLSLFAKYFYSIIFIVVVILIYSIVLVTAGYLSIKKGNRSAKFFLGAWTLPLLGTVAYGLKAFGILPEMFITKYGVPLGASMQMALLSIGLADKINTMRKDLVAMNTDLEVKVQERTVNLEKTNEILRNEIKDRKRAEEQIVLLAELVDNAPNSILVHDFKGRMIYANQKTFEMHGYDKDEFMGMNLHDIDVPESEKQIEKRMKQIDEKGAVSFEVSHFRKDGSTFPMLAHVKKTNWGGESAFLSVGTDITGQKKIEARLQQTQKLEAIGTLAGGIAHDFNNILSIITGYAELSLLKLDSEKSVRQNLDKILKAGERARDLVKQILTFSLHSKSKFSPVRIRPIVKEVIKFIRATLPASIEIKQNLKDDPAVMADATQIHQVIMNLCTNAGYAMQDKDGALEIGLETIALDAEFTERYTWLKPGMHIKLTVSDTGCGIEPEVAERIFDPFFTTKEKGKGTGMGLATAHGIIQSHEGDISVESELGKGSKFKVYLPAVPDSIGMEKVSELELARGSEQILLVDDEQDIIKVEKEMLEELGYTVTTKKNAQEALGIFTLNPNQFDLVITDMTMPKMTGDKLAMEMIKIKPDIPVILCTGFNEGISEETTASMGIKGFILKPVSLKDFSVIIRKVIDCP